MVTECPPILEFDRVKVTSPLEKAFLKFQKPSPIQSAVWPVLMANRDVVGIAETGYDFIPNILFTIDRLNLVARSSS